jgi:hypothetical protein
MNMRKMAGASLTMTLMVTVPTGGMAQTGWTNDLRPIGPADWNYERAAHLLERAGFGGTPEEIERLAAMTPADAVAYFVNFEDIDNSHLEPFDHSGVHDSGLEPFPPSRPAVTDLAKETGEALGIRVKPAGNRRLQPVVNKFFYWLRASVLETNRVSYWWANRMVRTNRPLEEKMALFWHGHFAVTESKVRDYRKGLGLLKLFYRHGTDNFKTLMLAVAKDPAMLSFLDAGVNVKGAPNENFAREIMEMFTMGVGHYTETDIREAARAFTGWNYEDLEFVVNDTEHDDGEKTLLGQTGTWDGDGTINIILDQPVTSEYIAGKIYRYFVREDISPDTRSNLGKILADNNYQIRPLLETIFLSRDFYGDRSVGTHIKSPVGLAISTFRKLGLKEVPGVPDFNRAMSALGQLLFRPPTVAGWAQGRSWITPGLLLERGNFARDILFPDINFIPPDRYNGSGTIRSVAARIAEGMDITSATMPVSEGPGEMAESNMLADRDEDFNTRYGSFRGWQMAIQRVKPIPRHAAQINLTEIVLDKGLEETEQVVDYFVHRFMRVRPAETERQMLVDFLTDELGTSDIRRAETYLEDPLRLLLHLIMSQPEYQLG